MDSPALAAARQRELDLPRHVASQLGRSAVHAIGEGAYARRDGQRVEWHPLVTAAVAAKVSIPPDAPLPAAGEPREPETRVEAVSYTHLTLPTKA